MKLLLDQNLSRRLLPDLEIFFPGSTQVALCGLDTAFDLAIWDFARNHGFTIVTKDADFLELAVFKGWPPKVLRLNMGNVSNALIKVALIKHAEAIREFLQDSREGALEID